MAYNISGTVTLDSSGLQHVPVYAVYDDAIVAWATTASDGTYTIEALTDARTYTVIPNRPGYTFSPESDSVTLAGSNVGGVDFAATAAGYHQYAVPGSPEIELALHQPPLLRVSYRGEPGALDEIVVGAGTVAFVGGAAAFGGAADAIEEIMPAGRDDARHWQVQFSGWETILQRRYVLIESATTETVADIIGYLGTQVLDNAGSRSENISVGTIDGGTTELHYPSLIYWTAADVMDHLAELIGGYWYITPWPRVLHLRRFGEQAAPWALNTSVDAWDITVRRELGDYKNVILATDRTSWDPSGTFAMASAGSDISARIAIEGGSGRHEAVVNMPEEISSEADMQAEADALLAKYNVMPVEVEYVTTETDLRPGMEQTVNLETEFGIPAATGMTVERVVMQQTATPDRWRSRVTLTGDVSPRTWERQMREALTSGQKPRTLPGARAMPRYYRA